MGCNMLQRTMGKFRGVTAPSFIMLMDSVAMLQRKPVRARSGCYDFHVPSSLMSDCPTFGN